MSTKTFLITGANSGIGYQTALHLAGQDHRLIVAARDQEKGQRAVEEIKKQTHNEQVFLQQLDLADLQSVRNAAGEILSRFDRLDVLINNAGLITSNREETKDGFERQIGVNHLGHFLLTHLLLPRIKDTAKDQGEARILCTSSNMHRRFGPPDLADLMWKTRKYGGMAAYGQSKVANILMANELARRHADAGIVALSFHPGAPKSNIYRNGNLTGISALGARLAYFLFGTPMEKGGEATVYLATSEEISQSNGQYWNQKKKARPVLPDNAEELASKLWERSAELVEINY